jgi:CheW-like domain
MNRKEGGGDQSDLEREIDSAVDTLLVEKKARSNPIPAPQKTLSPVQEATITDKFTTPPSKKLISPIQEATITDNPPSLPPSTSQVQTKEPFSRELKEKLEEVEAQLLTLEWDISSKHINNAITHLQDLRKLSHVGDELEKVIILIQKVLHQLILDESKLTPAALKFLQKSWKAVKGMTDERFSFEIDKKTLVQELIVEFQKLKIEGAPREVVEGIEARRPLEERSALFAERAAQKPPVEAKIPFTELDKFMNKIENLIRIVDEERKRWESIHKEIGNLKAEMQKTLSFGGKNQRESHSEEIIGLAERLERGASRPSDLEFTQAVQKPSVAVSLVNVSGIIFGIPEKQIIRIFPIKRWVSDFFVERGKVKLKNREIPLFNMVQVFKLKPSTEENPQVVLLRGREDHPAAIIVDQAVSREEIEYQPIEGRPYILGQGKSKSGRVWILDAEQVSP